MRPVSILPIFDHAAGELSDGAMVDVCEFCKGRLQKKDKQCLRHYEMMRTSNSAFRMCPYGFTSYPFRYRGDAYSVTGVVAAPRFGNPKEMARAKDFPSIRVSRQSILRQVGFFSDVASSLEAMEDAARRRIPQALHELRKLNAIVKSSVETLGGSEADSQAIRDISGSAELMSNVFDVIEALANIEELETMKANEFIAVYDLAYKAKKIYQGRAKLKPIYISVEGDDSVAIAGNKNTFPLVLTVLLENAIKYGTPGSIIKITVGRSDENCFIEIRNKSENPIDPIRCFEKGTRFGSAASDGDGLGLYLASAIIRAHHGSLRCVNVDGEVVMTAVLPSHAERRSARKANH